MALWIRLFTDLSIWDKGLKQKILIADDEEEIRDILQSMFEEDFELCFAKTGKEVLEKLAEDPQIVILDMHLPDISGIKICAEIEKFQADLRPSIVVLSGDLSDSLVKKAYQHGASDYVGKPFNVITFHERIIRLSKDIISLRELRQKDRDIASLAQTAMKQAASYGRALELVAKLNDCNTVQDIMQAVGKNLLSQDLKIAIQLRSETETFSYDIDSGECSAIELQIFDVLKEHGRIYHFGRRTIFNDKHVSILVKNMPFEGTLSYDAILDVAAKLILAVNSRFISLLEHQALLVTREKLGSAMDMLNQGINNLEFERQDLMKRLEMQISLSFHELDMTEEQERYFVNLINSEIRAKQNNNNLVSLRELITNCVDSMAVTVSESKNSSDEMVEISDDDVELF